jgi:hypothetical protein
MALSFKFYTDAALTTPLTSNLVATQNVDGSSDPVVHTIYLGSTTTSRQLQANSNPGVDQITVSLVDSAPTTGHPTTDVKLALTENGLATATAGAALDLGVQILSGTVNAKAIWIELDDSTLTLGTSTELSITSNALRETAV